MKSGRFPLRIKLGQQAILLLALVVAIQLLLTWMFFDLLRQSDCDYRRELMARQFRSTCDKLVSQLYDAGSEVELYFRNGDRRGFDEFHYKLMRAEESEAKLRTLAGEPKVSSLLESIDKLERQALSLANECVRRESELPLPGQREAIRAQYGLKVAAVFRDAEGLFKELIGSQSEIIELTPKLLAESRESMRKLLQVGLLLNLSLAGCLTGLFVTRISSRLSDAVDTLKRIGKGEIVDTPVNGNDEIAILDRSIREMGLALLEATVRERATIENAQDIILTVQPNGLIVSANLALTGLLGVSSSEIKGNSVFDLILGDDHPLLAEAMSSVSSGKQQSSEIDCRMLAAVGGSRAFSWSIYGEPGFESLYMIGRDMQHRKDAEAKLRRSETTLKGLIDNISAGLLIVDNHDLIRFANPKALSLLSVSAGEIFGQPLTSIFPVAEGTAPKPFLDSLLNECMNRSSILEILSRSGRRIPVELIVGEYDFEGRRCLLFTFIDLSSRQELERLKREFIAMVSHDLRGPLNSISVFLELLEKGNLFEVSDVRQRAARANANARNLVRLVSDLLDIEKIESGNITLSRGPVEVWDLVEEVLEALAPVAEAKNLQLYNECSEAIVFCDKERIRQVLTNLVSNAIKFSDAAKCIFVTCLKRDELVEVSVKDEGCGVSPSEQSELFKRFAQGQAGKNLSQGCGLGLAICRTLVEQHGGQVGLESDGRTGSRFWFTLPAWSDSP